MAADNLRIRKFTMVAGVLMLLMGLISLIPALSSNPNDLPALYVTNSYGMFLGFFPMNILNKLALIIFGIAGMSVSRSRSSVSAVRWSWSVFMIMGFCALAGFIPGLDTLYGFWPLFGGETLAHGVFAISAGYYAYTTAYVQLDAKQPRPLSVNQFRSSRT